ncbi:MAG: ATP synthase subunit delta [Parcubacteria group bacterium GW2011_GWC2_44_17]|uniref:Uncharacterized protein n=1 Tax=Candidatus Jacksonbacteria bacterium RIFCSPLOWO2_02_FULL_44_20 TaxID=1798460 RepID=A0A1G2A7G2_9BACT|nr:MAG: ATP synthase subunit delta [Parcubacteria group bacterium GW2011_GWC2_44_17]KKT49695.1 MAG: ATP synthase subunit delta [Parcubacteria group bacterium GW2011_GWF2_44_17]OGY71730.1 MAG: hypothetical protein A3C00_01920 [Candidatus Jacksonbacteria bacterium RIFCSPHIGHO2_02_FULL_44_25]OGY72615.1 MAG: hypothetical protein A3H61_03340 [Candidatus Jacksonbacteria bacterium RIFCSPLOWO2_02_FULL_44_20]OGY73886.1 MAG: hypothetical protein A3H07_00810 [Candidatus Jacksonbacteria bacterium RIFCSPLOW
MSSIHDYLQAMKYAVSEERYTLALAQLQMARQELNESRMRELEFAGDSEKRIMLLNKWFGDFLTKEVKNTLALLAEDRKLAELNEIGDESAKDFITVTTARQLNQQLKEWLMKELESAFGSARAIFKTDSSLIGGVKIRAGDREVDASLKARLENIIL